MLRSSTEETADRQLLQEEVCWICLDGDIAGPGNQLLISPCSCPRKVHPTCMARWQLQQAGHKEETHCRFCNQELKDWKENMTPKSLRAEMEGIQPIMVVYSQGVKHRIPVNPGEDGLEEFRRNIREKFDLTEDYDMSFTFGCKVPMTGEQIELKGESSYNAAFHCATVAGAKRLHSLISGVGLVVPGGTASSQVSGLDTSIAAATHVHTQADQPHEAAHESAHTPTEPTFAQAVAQAALSMSARPSNMSSAITHQTASDAALAEFLLQDAYPQPAAECPVSKRHNAQATAVFETGSMHPYVLPSAHAAVSEHLSANQSEATLLRIRQDPSNTTQVVTAGPRGISIMDHQPHTKESTSFNSQSMNKSSNSSHTCNRMKQSPREAKLQAELTDAQAALAQRMETLAQRRKDLEIAAPSESLGQLTLGSAPSLSSGTQDVESNAHAEDVFANIPVGMIYQLCIRPPKRKMRGF